MGNSDKLIMRVILVLSVVVFGLIVALYNLPPASHLPEHLSLMPMINACINATCAILLIVSYVLVRKGHYVWHKRLNISAFMLSCLFLLSYVYFHSFGMETSYPKDAPMRPFYLFILLTHIVLAAVVLPLVLLSFYHGLKDNRKAHKRIVRFSFPIWLYVTITGVIVYVMISPYYDFS